MRGFDEFYGDLFHLNSAAESEAPTSASLPAKKGTTISDQRPQAGWRTKIGFAIFVASIGWPVLLPIFSLLGMSMTVTAIFSGVMIIAAEFMLIAGAAIAGKEGFAFIKAKVTGVLNSHEPPRQVSRTRYNIGLLMFTTSLVFGWASPYIASHFPELEPGRLIYAIAFDMLLLTSLFVLGGGFWNKLGSLFTHDAYAVSPSASTPADKPE